MSEFTATVSWHRQQSEAFVDNHYSRGHTWKFDGGITVPASASPHIVPLPYSIEENVDPEEAFVASLSSCHMLFFLSIAAKRRLCVDSYADDAIGMMEEDSEGKPWISKVILRPKATFSGDKSITREQLEKMHHQAHSLCFLASSVKTEVTTEIPM